MKDIYIYHHLGLGDSIACNGLVRHILEISDNTTNIFVFCKKNFFKIIKFMYRDQSRINLIPLENNIDEQIQVNKYLQIIKQKNTNIEFIKIGHEKVKEFFNKYYSKKDPITFDMAFYYQMNIPYEFRFTKSYWERDLSEENRVFKKLTNNGDTKYAFIHDDIDMNYKIDNSFVSPDLKIIRNDKNEIVFNLGKTLELAEEIHLMESSIRNMSENLDLRAKKLFLYNWRRLDIGPIYSSNKNKIIGSKHNWEVIFANPNMKNNIFFKIKNFYIKKKFFLK